MPDVARGGEAIFLVLVSGKPGREAAYRRWFTTRHMADMRALPGVNSAHAFDLEPAGRAPAALCALYEFPDGGGALATIAQSNGTSALPQSDDQGAMTWRLYETAACAPQAALPAGADMVVVLLELARDEAPPAGLTQAANALAAGSGAYVRTLNLSPLQPARGSEYGAALLIGGQTQAAVGEALDQHLPGVGRALLLARAAG
jgi:hypothetical protein